MRLRDKYAIAAMQSLYAAGEKDREWIAQESYQIADAMLKERENWDFSNDPDSDGCTVEPIQIVMRALDEEWQPDWSQAPEWAKWWAMDKNKAAWWCEGKPIMFEDQWGVGNSFTYAKSLGYTGHWQESLRQRPTE